MNEKSNDLNAFYYSEKI